MSNPGFWIMIGLAVVLLGSTILRLRCAHGWDLVDKTEFPAPILVAKQVNQEYRLHHAEIQGMCRKKVVIVLRCNKCGAARIEKFEG